MDYLSGEGASLHWLIDRFHCFATIAGIPCMIAFVVVCFSFFVGVSSVFHINHLTNQ